MVCVVAVGIVISTRSLYHSIHVPDLSRTEAASLISRAPEFNRYATLVSVEEPYHLKNSMDQMSMGDFTFRYKDASVNEPTIQADADFRYWDGEWHLNEFSYGCPKECHTVDIDNNMPTNK